MFFDTLYKKAQQRPKRVAFVDGTYADVVKAARMFKDRGFGVPYLVGKRSEIATIAGLQNISLDGIELIEMPSPSAQAFGKEYAELRKAKGVTLEQALEKMQQPHYVAMMYLRQGLVDGVVSGYTSATKPFLPAFEIVRPRQGIGKASSYFLMTREEKTYLFADCGLQIQPTSEELADIGIATAESAKFLGLDPKVAFLSFSTQGTAKGPDVEKVQNAVKLATQKRPDLLMEGEMQFDTAILPEVCKKKYPQSKIMGQANVLIFPDLDAGNLGYKITERLGGFHAVGPLLQGLNKPVQDLSRGAKVEDILDSAVICVIQAQK